MVKIEGRYLGDLRCEATHGPSGSTLRTDAPADNHGKGENFSPTDLVATALGTCIVTILGITHAKNWSSLFHPVVGTTHGGLMTVPFTAVLALTAVAVFSYNGYANAVNFSEETTGSSRRIARAILWSLVITVAAELIPLTFTIVGSPSLAKLTTSAVPMQYFIEATSNKTVYTIVSLAW